MDVRAQYKTHRLCTSKTARMIVTTIQRTVKIMNCGDRSCAACGGGWHGLGEYETDVRAAGMLACRRERERERERKGGVSAMVWSNVREQ